MYCCTVVQYRYGAECVLLGALISHAPCFQVVKTDDSHCSQNLQLVIRIFWECEEFWVAGDISANQLSYSKYVSPLQLLTVTYRGISYTPLSSKFSYSNLFVVNIKMKLLLFYCSYSQNTSTARWCFWYPIVWVNTFFLLLVSILQPGTPWRRGFRPQNLASYTLHSIVQD